MMARSQDYCTDVSVGRISRCEPVGWLPRPRPLGRWQVADDNFTSPYGQHQREKKALQGSDMPPLTLARNRQILGNYRHQSRSDFTHSLARSMSLNVLLDGLSLI